MIFEHVFELSELEVRCADSVLYFCFSGVRFLVVYFHPQVFESFHIFYLDVVDCDEGFRIVFIAPVVPTGSFYGVILKNRFFGPDFHSKNLKK